MIQRALFFTIIVVVGGVLANWLFVLIYGSRIWAYDRWLGGAGSVVISILVYGIFLCVFPLLYLLSSKVVVITKALQHIWQSYRDEFLALIVEHAVTSTLAVRTQGHTLITQAQDWFATLPKLVKRLVAYIQQKIPFVAQIEGALGEIDRETQYDPQVIQQQVMEKISTSVTSSSLPVDLSFLWWLLGINILCMLLVGVLVT